MRVWPGRGWQFEITLSNRLQEKAAIAQLAARRSHNPKVVSSILTRRIFFTVGKMQERKRLFRKLKLQAQFSDEAEFSQLQIITGPVAQWIRHRPTEPGIAGSSPAGVIFHLPPHGRQPPSSEVAKFAVCRQSAHIRATVCNTVWPGCDACLLKTLFVPWATPTSARRGGDADDTQRAVGHGGHAD